MFNCTTSISCLWAGKSWYSQNDALGWHWGEESLNKVVILVFFAHKNDSRSFIKLQLDHWCHMDYFNDVLATFLCLDRVRILAVYGRVRKLSEFIRNNLCTEDERRSWRWVINYIILIFVWTVPLRSSPVCCTLSVESQHGLNGDVDAVELVGLEHDLGDLLPVLQRVQGRLRQQDLTVGRADVEPLRAEGVIPQVQHVLPAADYPVLHGVRDLQHGAAFARLITNHQILQRGEQCWLQYWTSKKLSLLKHWGYWIFN